MRVYFQHGYWNAVMDGLLVARDQSLTAVLHSIRDHWDNALQ